MDTRAIPTPAALAPPEGYDRGRWETAVLGSGLHRNSRVVALVLAHYADADGRLPAGGIQHTGRLVHLAKITPKQARLSITQLETQGFISRPDMATWEAKDVVRPVALVMPARGRRPVESHTDELS
ncbi:hypothetical protein KVH22_29885 [Streptomyces olivaceus]|uniref:hypothetical protein n=1 Tax=Streptomyces olivaceus TaxID=47716 RepID=UPI001CC9C81A|nr:hypothetical protein [Streptomyces olivaceus]MBZ6259730.1 hypothetical protein [Streptomyces olivaceus]